MPHLRSSYASRSAILIAASLILTVSSIDADSGPGGPDDPRLSSGQQDGPNIIIFLGDDAGWRDSGAYGNTAVRTPNIDQLARDGLRVDRAFVTTSQCSPSRISILTGKYPHSTGAEDLHDPLPEGERIVPSFLQDRDYFTGHMLKTHYGPHADSQFQWYSQQTADAFPEFLDAAGERPFFLWVGFSDPHRPYQPGSVDPPHDPAEVQVPPYLADTPETRRDLALYYDEVSRMDAAIGRMLAELDRRGLRENTLVIYTSDNGMPFMRAKGTNYDEGIRTPLILSWPRSVAGGQVYSRGMVSLVDLAPTLLELAGIATPETMQGSSIADLLSNPDTHEGREYVFSERNWHSCDEHIRSVRTERFKLIRTDDYLSLPMCVPSDIGSSLSFFSLRRLKKEGKLTAAQELAFQAPRPRIELYDLDNDPWELRNVADEEDYAAIALELSRLLGTWGEETGDFSAWYRVRDDATDRITGVRFRPDPPPRRRAEVPDGPD